MSATDQVTLLTKWKFLQRLFADRRLNEADLRVAGVLGAVKFQDGTMLIKVHRREPHRLIRIREVLRKVGDSQSKWYEEVKAGRAPKPIKIGAHAVAWYEPDVDDVIDARLAEREWQPSNDVKRGRVIRHHNACRATSRSIAHSIAKLMLMHSHHGGQEYFVVPGGHVDRADAQKIIARPYVHPFDNGTLGK